MFGARVPVRRITVALITVMATTLGLFGCEGSPDLSQKAEQVGSVLEALPGVETVETICKNDDSGRSLVYLATMTVGAIDDEAIHLASTLNDELGSEFEYYVRGLTVMLSELRLVLREETAVETLSQLTSRLRALAPSLDGEESTWIDSWDDEYSDDVLEINDVSGSPFDVFTAVRDQFGAGAGQNGIGAGHRPRRGHGSGHH